MITDENLRVETILSEDPLPRLVELVRSVDPYPQENAVRLLNSMAMRNPQPVLDHHIVDPLIQVITNHDELFLLFLS